MDKFKRSLNGYNVDEVNAFIDDVIKKVETIIKEEEEIKNEIKNKELKIKELENLVEHYKNIEKEMNTSIITAQESGEYIKRLAKSERDAIINDARKNANRIISDALIRAEKTEYKTELLRKNIISYKNRVRTMLNQQLDIIDDLDEEILN